jgi:hypothetical protein
MVVGAVVVLWICFPPRNMFGRDEGYAEDIGALRQVLRKQICDALPSDATNISYIYERRYGSGDFQLTLPEQEFLSWAERQGWNVQRVISPECKTIWNPTLGNPRRVTIRDGYYYRRRNAETPPHNYLLLAYDNDTNTLYLGIAPPYKGDMFKN